MTVTDEARFRILRVDDPLECAVVKRVNRFAVTVRIEGETYVAHTNNTGRLQGFLVEGRKGHCVRNRKPGKTDYRLFAVSDGALGAIIDTQLQMKAFERSLEMNLIPWLPGCRILKRNARLAESLIDYLLECDGKEVYLEVKSAVLREGHYAMYPDCPSSRGRRHIIELTNLSKQGGEAIILFIAALPEVHAFKPNKSGDPELSRLLRQAQETGVRMKSTGMFYDPRSSFVRLSNPDLRVELI